MPSDGTIGGLVGKLDVLRIECPTCGRQGRYHVARLIEELGPRYRLTDWLHERTADCLGRCPQTERSVDWWESSLCCASSARHAADKAVTTPRA
jgi:hypothetical protein